MPFLESLGAAAGLAVGRLRVTQAAGGIAPEAPPALECPDCGSVADAGEPPGCSCGSAYVETEVPALLAGLPRVGDRRLDQRVGEVQRLDVREVARRAEGRYAHRHRV